MKMDDLKNQDSVDDIQETTEQLEENVNVQADSTSQPESSEETQGVNASTSEPIVNEIEIGGEKYTLDEIQEFKRGYLRQSDYTRKTQELARQREEMADAIELYNYLRDNPHLLYNLQENIVDPNIADITEQLTPAMQKIQELEMKIAQQELEYEINMLKTKYDDFDEVKVLQEAEKRGITDLEFVYKALREDDKVDVEKIKQEAVAEAKKQILAELQQNKEQTKTLIDKKDAESAPTTIQLTPDQKRVAFNMGLTEEEYAKWMSK